MLIYIDGMREKTFAVMASSVLLLFFSKASAPVAQDLDRNRS
jgi:hypothetical protein